MNRKFIAIPAIAIAAGIGLTACGMTSTPKPAVTVTAQAPAAATTPAPAQAAPAPARTVYAQPAPAQTGYVPASAPAPAVPASSLTGCGGGIYAGPNTSCTFAENVSANYTGAGSDYAYSSVTGESYDMTCSAANAENWVYCTGGNDASVQFIY